jgi:diguanylate cyclase (GGDEF)-like protein
VRRRNERALAHRSLHDHLTGLPNRVLFQDRLSHALAAAARAGGQVGVLYLDLDGFKGVNDTAGHGAGDELLQEVAHRFSTCLRPGDTIARLGGDEFAIVCSALPGPGTVGGTEGHAGETGRSALEALRTVGSRLLATMAQPCVLDAGPFTVGVSIGGTLAGLPDGPEPDAVLRCADAAMYVAKRAGRNRVHITCGAGTDTPRPLAVA